MTCPSCSAAPSINEGTAEWICPSCGDAGTVAGESLVSFEQSEFDVSEALEEARALCRRAARIEMSIERALGKVKPNRPSGCPATLIVSACASAFGVPSAQIMGKDNRQAQVAARHAAFFLAAKFNSWSLPEIGRRLGGWHHTTVLSGIGRARWRSQSEPAFVEKLTAARRIIEIGRNSK